MIVWLLGLAIRGVVLLLVSCIAALLLRKASPSSRRLAWLLGIVSVVALPLVWRVTPEVSVPPDKIPGYMEAVRLPPVNQAISKFADYTKPQTDVAQPGFSATLPAPKPLNFLDLSMYGWALASALLLLRSIVGIAALSRLIRTAMPWTDTAFADRRIRLVTSDRISVPATAGVFRPVLILPSEAKAWPEQKLRMVMAHEKAHVRRLDWFWSQLAQFACIMYPFNPFAWVAAAQLRAESERVADDQVLDEGYRAVVYAQQLIEIARDVRRTPATVVAMANTPRVEGRVRCLLDSKRRRGAVGLGILATASLAAVLTCASLAAFRLGDTTQSEVAPGIAMDFTKGWPEGWKGPVTIQVTDENGNAVKGAKLDFKVMVFGSIWAPEGKTLWAPIAQAEGTTHPAALTDESGVYELQANSLREEAGIPGAFRAGDLSEILAYLPGHAITAVFLKKGDRNVSIRLGRSSSVQVPVVGPDGRPTPGIALTVRSLRTREWGDVLVPKSWRTGALRSVSDERGLVTFADIPKGSDVAYDIDDGRYLPAPVEQHNPAVSATTLYAPVKLTPSSTIEGDVLLNGKPVPGIAVQVSGTRSISTTTDENGHYNIGRVPNGLCNVQVFNTFKEPSPWPDGWVAKQHDGLRIEPGQAVRGVDFNFERGGLVRGRIVDENGKPLQVEVDAFSPEYAPMVIQLRGMGQPSDYHGMSDRATGRFEVRVPPGRYRLQPGILPYPPDKWVEVKEGQVTEMNFQVDIKSRTHIAGGANNR